MGIVEERGEHYGDPRPNHERIAAMWSAYLGHPVTAHDVAVCMILVKASRAKAGRNPDNYTDIAGYAEIARGLA
jgi:hypothetical protein